MLAKRLQVVAVALGLALPLVSHSQTTLLGNVSASATGATGQSQQGASRDSSYGTWAASATWTDTFYYYPNGVPTPVYSTANASIQADLAPGSIALNASGKSGGLTGFGTEDARASASFEFDVTSPSVWTLTLDDHTSGYGEYNIYVYDWRNGGSMWQDHKTEIDHPPRNQTFSLALDPGQYLLSFEFDAVNLTDTGTDAGSLSLAMTSPVPLPASAWLLASAVGLLGVLRRLGAPRDLRTA